MNLFLSFPARRFGARSFVVKFLLQAFLVSACVSGAAWAQGGPVTEGQRVALLASADGSPAPTFQWRKNGTPIAGATGATLEFPTVTLGDAGNYDVVATNSIGSTASPVELLVVEPKMVNVAPVFTVQPVPSQSANEGSTVTFKVEASGVPAPTYRWLKNGVVMAGATSSTLTMISVTASDVAVYAAVAENSAGSITSSAGLLSVVPRSEAPVFTTQPVASQAVNAGTSVTLSVAASGIPAPTFKWLKNGVVMVSQVSSSLTLVNTTLSDTGVYSVVAENIAGVVTSNTAIVKILIPPPSNVAPSFTLQPVSNQSVKTGETVTFTISAAGTPVPSVKWLKNGSVIAGQTSSTLTLTNVTTADSAVYAAVAENTAGSATSSSATLTVLPPPPPNVAPSFTLQPIKNQSVKTGATATFTVVASGSPAPTFKWLKNGSVIAGQTSSTLTLFKVTSADSATYAAVAENLAGTVTSTSSFLKVLASSVAPSLKSQPASQTVAVGSNATFAVEVEGSPIPSVQWYRDGSVILGAIGPTLVVDLVAVSDADAVFTAVASNTEGSVTSNGAVLSVASAPGGSNGGSVSRLGGTVISSGPYNDQATFAGMMAFDGNVSTFFASAQHEDVAFVGRDFGRPKIVHRIRYVPRIGFSGRMKGGEFRGANRPDLSDAVTLHTIPFNPPDRKWQEVGLDVAVAAYRYVFFTTSHANNGNVAELEFYGTDASAAIPAVAEMPRIVSQPKDQTIVEGGSVTLTVGTHRYQWFKDGEPIDGATNATYQIPTALGLDAGSYHVVVTNEAGATVSRMTAVSVTNVATETALTGKVISSAAYADNADFAGNSAFDGNGATFFASHFEAPLAFVGQDLGSARTVTRIRYLPRDEFTARMTGGRFCGANSPDLSDAVTLHTIAKNPSQGVWQDVALENAAAFRYVFFTTNHVGNGNVAEIEFFGLPLPKP